VQCFLAGIRTLRSTRPARAVAASALPARTDETIAPSRCLYRVVPCRESAKSERRGRKTRERPRLASLSLSLLPVAARCEKREWLWSVRVRCRPTRDRFARTESRPVAAAFDNPSVRKRKRRPRKRTPAANRFIGASQGHSLPVLKHGPRSLLPVQVSSPPGIGEMKKRCSRRRARVGRRRVGRGVAWCAGGAEARPFACRQSPFRRRRRVLTLPQRSTRCESKRGAAGKTPGNDDDAEEKRRRGDAPRLPPPPSPGRVCLSAVMACVPRARACARAGDTYACNGRRIFWSIGQDSECEHAQQDPKGGDLCQATAKPWETVVDAGTGTDVQIVCQSVGIGAKDSSNHLVAGSLRSFPQDSWSARAIPLSRDRTPKNAKNGAKRKKKLVMQARALMDSLGNHRRLCWPSNCEVACRTRICVCAKASEEKAARVVVSLWWPCRRPETTHPTWAISGKQYWRCGMNRKHGSGDRVLAHPDPRKDVACY